MKLKTLPSFAVVLIAASSLLWTVANAQSDSKPAFDYLWLLDKKDEAHLAIEFQTLITDLNSSVVPDTNRAISIAVETKRRMVGGWLAEESANVTSLLKLGRDVPDFARNGDLIWVVRINNHLSGRTMQELWISSTTGKTKYILPF